MDVFGCEVPIALRRSGSRWNGTLPCRRKKLPAAAPKFPAPPAQGICYKPLRHSDEMAFESPSWMRSAKHPCKNTLPAGNSASDYWLPPHAECAAGWGRGQPQIAGLVAHAVRHRRLAMSGKPHSRGGSRNAIVAASQPEGSATGERSAAAVTTVDRSRSSGVA
jgi:hypothetical protein